MLASAMSQATLAVTDVDRAKKYYGGTLGLTPSFESAEATIYQTGAGTSFIVYPSEFAGTCKSTSITLFVDDFDAAVKDLRERGIVFEEYDTPQLKTVEGVADLGGSRVAWFKDPDGNILALAEPPR